jgi:hypothetical protein
MSISGGCEWVDEDDLRRDDAYKERAGKRKTLDWRSTDCEYPSLVHYFCFF